MLEVRFASIPVLLLTVVTLLQATLLTLCTTLCALNQDGSYATLPWLTWEEAGKLYGGTALSKAAKLEALSLQDTPQCAEQQPMQEAAQHTGKQLLTGDVQQPQQQSEQQPMQEVAPYTNVQQSQEQQLLQETSCCKTLSSSF